MAVECYRLDAIGGHQGMTSVFAEPATAIGMSEAHGASATDATPVLNPDLPTFADLLLAAEASFPEQPAFKHGDEEITYGAWVDQALRVAEGFKRRGVKAGDVVLIGIDNSIDFAICFAATQLIGAIASGVNVRLGRREIDAIVAKSNATLLVLADDALHPQHAPPVVVRSELAALRAGRDRAAPYSGQRGDIAVIIWTSGTTGTPKGACFTHDNLRNAVITAGPMAAPFARRLSSVPFAHAGFMAKGWEHVAFAMTLIVSPTPWSADAMLHLLSNERVNIATAVPTQWTKLLAHPDLPQADLSHVKVGITATAPAPPELIEQVSMSIGVPLIVRYSMTECPSMTGTRIGDSPAVQYQTVGRPQVGVELRVVAANGSDAARGAVGAIHVRSKAVMVGYWNDPQRSAEGLTTDGWLVTGDFGRLDDSGNLILAGRASDMYIRGGYNVYPIEVERVIGEMSEVSAVALVGKPAPTIGEIGVAFIVPADPGSPPTLEAVRAKVRSELADYKAPDEIVLTEALPLTPMMKIDKQSLRSRAAACETVRD